MGHDSLKSQAFNWITPVPCLCTVLTVPASDECGCQQTKICNQDQQKGQRHFSKDRLVWNWFRVMAAKRKKDNKLLKRVDKLVEIVDCRIIDASLHHDIGEKLIYPPNIDGASETQTEVLYDEQDKVFTVSCPHCSDFVQILAKQMNCKQCLVIISVHHSVPVT